MKEKLKTFLLFSLVAISVFITQELWIKLPSDFLKNIERNKEVSSVSYFLSDMISPNKYLINFNSEDHTLVYDDSRYGLWSKSIRKIAEIFESKNIKTEIISNEDYIKYQSNKSVIFYFSEEISTYILAKAWNIKKPNDLVDSMPNIKSIYIYLDNGDPFFVLTGEGKHMILSDSNIDTKSLREEINTIESNGEFSYYYSMRDSLGTENDIYIPFVIKNMLPRVFVTNGITTLDEPQKNQLAEQFLDKDIGYIQEIIEGNGSSIYIYNQKYIKFNINGTLEYFNALEDTINERNLYQSLLAATDFISEKAGVQQGMYLARVEEIKSDNNLGFRLTFRYRVRGIPVILGNHQVNEYIQMDVFKDHVRNYTQYLRQDMSLTPNTVVENKTMLTSYDILDMNDNILMNRYLLNNTFEEGIEEQDKINKVLNSIEDITMSYYDPCLKDKEERLIGVWVIRLQGRLLAFDAYSGLLVYER